MKAMVTIIRQCGIILVIAILLVSGACAGGVTPGRQPQQVSPTPAERERETTPRPSPAEVSGTATAPPGFVVVSRDYAVGLLALRIIARSVGLDVAVFKRTTPVESPSSLGPQLKFEVTVIDDRGNEYSMHVEDNPRHFDESQLPQGFVYVTSETYGGPPARAFDHIVKVLINGQEVKPLDRFQLSELSAANAIGLGEEVALDKDLAATPMRFEELDGGMCLLLRVRNADYAGHSTTVALRAQFDTGEIGEETQATVGIAGQSSEDVCVPVPAFYGVRALLVTLGDMPGLVIVEPSASLKAKATPTIIPVSYREHCAGCGFEIVVNEVQLQPTKRWWQQTIAPSGQKGEKSYKIIIEELGEGYKTELGLESGYNLRISITIQNTGELGRLSPEFSRSKIYYLGEQEATVLRERGDEWAIENVEAFAGYSSQLNVEEETPLPDIEAGQSWTGWFETPQLSADSLQTVVGIVIRLGGLFTEELTVYGTRETGWISIQAGQPFIELRLAAYVR